MAMAALKGLQESRVEMMRELEAAEAQVKELKQERNELKITINTAMAALKGKQD